MSKNITEDNAKPRKYPPISDIYFYLELLESVGPEASNDWLHRTSIEMSKRLPAAERKPPILTTNRNKNVDVLLRTNESKTSHAYNFSNTETSNRSLRGSMEAPPALNGHSRSGSKHSDFNSLIALDIELTAEPASNFGLLFTDAAHIFIKDFELQSAGQRRKSSVF